MPEADAQHSRSGIDGHRMASVGRELDEGRMRIYIMTAIKPRPAGPYVCDADARPWLNAHHSRLGSDTVVSQAVLRAGRDQERPLTDRTHGGFPLKAAI